MTYEAIKMQFLPVSFNKRKINAKYNLYRLKFPTFSLSSQLHKMLRNMAILTRMKKVEPTRS